MAGREDIGVTVPAMDAAAVTPGDSGSGVANGETTASKGLYIGTAGTTAHGSVVNFGSVAAGILPLQTVRVHSTGTDASNIVALY